MFVHKVAGAIAEAGHSLDKVYEAARRAVSECVRVRVRMRVRARTRFAFTRRTFVLVERGEVGEAKGVKSG